MGPWALAGPLSGIRAAGKQTPRCVFLERKPAIPSPLCHDQQQPRVPNAQLVSETADLPHAGSRLAENREGIKQRDRGPREEQTRCILRALTPVVVSCTWY